MNFFKEFCYHHSEGGGNFDELHNTQHADAVDAINTLREASEARDPKAVKKARRGVADSISQLVISTRLLQGDEDAHRNEIAIEANTLLPDNLKFS